MAKYTTATGQRDRRPLLGNIGLSIRRDAKGFELERAVTHLGRVSRGNPNARMHWKGWGTKHAHIKVINSGEVKNMGHVAHIYGNVAVRRIVERVPGLMEPLPVTFNDFEEDTRPNGESYFILNATAKGAKRLREERGLVIGAINALNPAERPVGLRPSTPGLVIAHTLPGSEQRLADQIRSELRAQLPISTHLMPAQFRPDINTR